MQTFVRYEFTYGEGDVTYVCVYGFRLLLNFVFSAKVRNFETKLIRVWKFLRLQYSTWYIWYLYTYINACIPLICQVSAWCAGKIFSAKCRSTAGETFQQKVYRQCNPGRPEAVAGPAVKQSTWHEPGGIFFWLSYVRTRWPGDRRLWTGIDLLHGGETSSMLWGIK